MVMLALVDRKKGLDWTDLTEIRQILIGEEQGFRDKYHQSKDIYWKIRAGEIKSLRLKVDKLRKVM